MKNKLRKITVDQTEYLYSVTDRDLFSAGTKTKVITVKIFLNGEKQTPLIIDFRPFDYYMMGEFFKYGFNLINTVTNSIEHFNINEPGYIQKLILKGREKGWSGKNRMEKQMDWIT